MCRSPAVVLLLASAVTAASAAEPLSTTEFRVDPPDDPQCTGSRAAVKPEWSRELTDRLPEVAALWAQVGPPMVKAVTDLTGKPFAAPTTVHLTLCETPSNSFHGVTVNMRYALRSFTATPVPLRFKVDTVFHESLHGFVSRHTPRTSSLLEAQAAESFCVRNHLHLLALQKAVLLALGDTEALAQVVAIDGQLPSGCYRRAWALVNAAPETYRRYVDELSR